MLTFSKRSQKTEVSKKTVEKRKSIIIESCMERPKNNIRLRFGSFSSCPAELYFLIVVATASSLPRPIAKTPIRKVIIIGNTEIFITSEVLMK